MFNEKAIERLIDMIYLDKCPSDCRLKQFSEIKCDIAAEICYSCWRKALQSKPESGVE